MLTYSFDYTQVFRYILLIIILYRIVCRWIIFRKMSLRPWLCLIPILSDYKVYKRCWEGWPFLLLVLLTIVFASIVPLTGYWDMSLPLPIYIKTNLQTVALITFVLIRILMYKRLAFAFGHDILFMLGLLFLDPIFLGILAFGKSTFQESRARLSGKELRAYLQTHRSKGSKILSVASTLLLLFTSTVYISNIMLSEHQPAYLVQKNNEKIHTATFGKVTGKGPVVSPRFSDGQVDTRGVRELYFPTKAGCRTINVYMYMIGSDLEETNGAASVNLTQIKEATKAGRNLRFIIQAGGSGRWFTDGIKALKAGRYMIADGEVTLLKDLGRNVCMSEPDTLQSFLAWANRNYPADRKMLFFWDHGGAISGFGNDHLNPRAGQSMLSMKEIRDALDVTRARYELIGFDACLMQSLEVGLCLEPYADYLLASEEGEPSTGMYYTAAFQRLAREPELSSASFGTMMCSSFDQSLELINDSAQAGSTLSLVDLRFLPTVRDLFFGYLEELDQSFRKNTDSFLSMSLARAKAYEFQMEDQIDLIDYLKKSDLPSSQKEKTVKQIQDAIVVRNKASAHHIYGLAVYMPYDNLYSYGNIRQEMNALGMESATKIYDDFASIIGGQKTDKAGKHVQDITSEDWFVKDFEDYKVSVYRKNIPLKKYTGKPLRYDNYVIQLPEKDWSLITNYELGMHMKVGDRYADLGSDNIYDRDEKGHYMVSNDKKWVAINNVLVALHPGPPIESGKDTTVYTGKVDATLNYVTPIKIYLRWVNEGNHEGDGEVIGYLPADEDSDNVDKHGMPRGYKKFKYNNTVTFLYDWYDEKGNFLKTAMGHRPVYVGIDGLTVTQKDIRTQEYEYYGILYDALGRTMETQYLTHKPEKKH